MDTTCKNNNCNLSCKGVALSDDIMQKGKPATAGSDILKGFIAPFSATVVEKLEAAGFSPDIRLPLDEFNIAGIENEQSDKISAAIKTVSEQSSISFALCNDLFGRVRREAAINGLCYIQPTYGTVSRYGLIPAASSMDQIGILCKDPCEGFVLLSQIAGKDDKDGTMFQESSYSYASTQNDIRIAIPDNAWATGQESQETILKLEQAFETTHKNLDYYEYYSQVCYILSCAEICNNTNRYDGIKFGYRSPNSRNINDLYIDSRSEAFGLDIKLTIIMGAMVLSQDHYENYYDKSMRIRRLIKESLKFDDYDVIALPVASSGNSYEQTALHALTALAGLPSLTIPYGDSAIQLIANVKNEHALLRTWEVLSV